MPYVKSAARQEFDTVVKGLLSLARSSSYKSVSFPHDVRQCVYRNAIFQVSAALEEYFRSVLEDWLHELRVNGKSVSEAPRELILWAFGKKQKSAFQYFLLDGDEGEFVAKLAAIAELPRFLDPGEILSGAITSAEHVRDRKYPSIKNLSVLFKRFGIRDIFKLIHKTARRDYKKVLESFSDVRTEIAHQHPVPDITLDDVKLHLEGLTGFVAAIDRVLCAHVRAVSGNVCWKTQRPVMI